MIHWYPRLSDRPCRPPSLGGCPATWEGDKLQLASEVPSRARELSAPASLKDQSCHLPYSTSTYLICQGRRHRSRRFATLTTWQFGLLDQRLRSGSPWLKLPERCKHLPEGLLAFDLCAEVNSHALHPGQTPVPDSSRYYSWRHTATTGAPS